jgi:hypothetical protein
MKAIKATISIATVLACMSIAAFYSMFVFLDALDIFCKRRKIRSSTVKPVVKKFKYKPSGQGRDGRRFIRTGERRELL